MQAGIKICQKSMFCCSVNGDLHFIVCFAIILRRLCSFVLFRSDLIYLSVQFGGTIQAPLFGLLHELCAIILLKTVIYVIKTS